MASAPASIFSSSFLPYKLHWRRKGLLAEIGKIQSTRRMLNASSNDSSAHKILARAKIMHG